MRQKVCTPLNKCVNKILSKHGKCSEGINGQGDRSNWWEGRWGGQEALSGKRHLN